jgi:ATP-dependent 26S proteasome regulatory subunit
VRKYWYKEWMMKYYSEVSKIVEGGLSNNKGLVVSYAKQLAEKLLKDGDSRAANGISKRVEGVSLNSINSQSVIGRPVPVEKDNRFSLADKIYPSESNTIVFLDEQTADVVDSFIKYIQEKNKLLGAGIPINPSLLLYGKPGTGKSKLAATLAARLNLPLVTARADALISSYLGSTSKNIRSLLEYAQAEPCVLFLDEFDAIAKARDDKNEIGELKRVVVSLLQNIDNLGDTILVAATNHQHLLDQAIWRRFHYKMELTAPSNMVREQIFNFLLLNFDCSSDDILHFVNFSKGLTGAEIEMCVYDYLRFIIINDLSINSVKLSQNLLKMNYSWLDFDKKHQFKNMLKLRELNEKVFNYRVLAYIYEMSSSNVGKILKGNK